MFEEVREVDFEVAVPDRYLLVSVKSPLFCFLAGDFFLADLADFFLAITARSLVPEGAA